MRVLMEGRTPTGLVLNDGLNIQLRHAAGATSLYEEIQILYKANLAICGNCLKLITYYSQYDDVSSTTAYVCESCLHVVVRNYSPGESYFIGGTPSLMRPRLGRLAVQKNPNTIAQPSVYRWDNFLGINFSYDSMLSLYPVGYSLLFKALREPVVQKLLEVRGYVHGDKPFRTPNSEICERDNTVIVDITKAWPLSLRITQDPGQWCRVHTEGFDHTIDLNKTSIAVGTQLVSDVWSACVTHTPTYNSSLERAGYEKFILACKASKLRTPIVVSDTWKSRLEQALAPFGKPEDVLKPRKTLKGAR